MGINKLNMKFIQAFLIAFISIMSLSHQKSEGTIRGTNAGGWMVLEPWITPSLFYKSLGKVRDEGVPVDSYTLCETYGPTVGNKVMTTHWQHWITEKQVIEMWSRNVTWVR